METQIEILIKVIKELSVIMAGNQTDYCETPEACRIIGINNPRSLKTLVDNGLLVRYKREGSRYIYKKKECYQAATLLDNGKIIL